MNAWDAMQEAGEGEGGRSDGKEVERREGGTERQRRYKYYIRDDSMHAYTQEYQYASSQTGIYRV